jgi:hypothetical protein
VPGDMTALRILWLKMVTAIVNASDAMVGK